MIDVELRTYLTTHAGVLAELPNATNAGAIQQNTIDQDSPTTRIWFQRSGNETELGNNSSLLEESTFDLECMSLDIDEAQDIAKAVKTALHGHQGILSTTFAHLIEVQDHQDDYQPRGQYADEGLHVASLFVRILH